MIDFRECDKCNLVVMRDDDHIATIRIGVAGIKIDLGDDGTDVLIADMQVILDKMKELQ